MKVELKPCPFCGSDDAAFHEYKAGTGAIECRKCAATAGMCETEELAIEAWNQRASEQANTGLIEALTRIEDIAGANVDFPNSQLLEIRDIAAAALIQNARCEDVR